MRAARTRSMRPSRSSWTRTSAAAGHEYYQLGAVEVSPDSRVAGLLRGLRSAGASTGCASRICTSGEILAGRDQQRRVRHRVGQRQRHRALCREGSRDPARAARQEASLGRDQPTRIRGCSRRPTGASTPASPSRSRSASSSSTWKAPCPRSGATRRPTIPRCRSRSFCRTSAITNTRSSTWAIGSSSAPIGRRSIFASCRRPSAGRRIAPAGATWCRTATIRSSRTSRCSSASSR